MNNAYKFLFTLLFVALATGLSYVLNGRSLMGIDDANIYFVYMKNVASGQGFIYNVGGERVEGFTSLLWTLIGSFFFLISTRPEILLLCFNILVLSYALWRLTLFIEKQAGERFLFSSHSLLFLGLLVCIPGYFDWTVLSLMETGLWSALLILTTLSLFSLVDIPGSNHRHREMLKFSTLICLQVLCRPESMLWVAFFICSYFCILVLHGNSLRKACFQVLPAFFAVAGTLLVLIFWRISYFGFPLPNTYYAKVSSNKIDNVVAGVSYLYHVVENNPLIIFWIPITIALVSKNLSKIKENLVMVIFSLAVLVSLSIPLYTGGDHFELSRFFQPSAPLLYVFVILYISKTKGWRLGYGKVLVILLFSLFIPKDTLIRSIQRARTPLTHEWNVATVMRERSKKMNLFFSDLGKFPEQGVLTAGGSALPYKGLTNDLLGLNNVEMAHYSKVKNPNSPKNHASFNKEVFFKQRPDIFFYGNSGFIDDSKSIEVYVLEIEEFQNLVFHNIINDSVFKELYSPVLISSKTKDYSLMVFASNEFVGTLQKNENYSVKVIDAVSKG